MKIKDVIKRTVVGTALEPIFRNVQSILRIGWSFDDILTQKIIKHILVVNSNCVDVGCHNGSILRMMMRFAPQGNHFAFEPIPEMYAELTRSFGHLANLHLYDNALSDIKGETSFQHVISNPAFSGLRKRKYPHPNEKIQEIAVKTDLLDNIIPEDMTIHLIKVDVEGAELQVFRGAMKTIKRCQPLVIFEHGLGAANYYGTQPEDVYDLLSVQCGLKLSLMKSWLENADRASLSRQAFCDQFSSGKNIYYIAYP